MKKNIEIVPYDPNWPHVFETESNLIKEVLGKNCIAIHHIGSTAVPGLVAKPIIDMIGIMKKPEDAIASLESIGYKYKGEYNIPMRFYFSKKEHQEVLFMHMKICILRLSLI